MEQAVAEQYESIRTELRQEVRARDVSEAALRKDLEDARQAVVKLAASSERNHTEVQDQLHEESRTRGQNIEALLSEWAGSQAEIRHAIESMHGEVDRSAQDMDRYSKSLIRESSAREAFERFFGEKLHALEVCVEKIQGSPEDTGRPSVSADHDTDSQDLHIACAASQDLDSDADANWVTSEPNAGSSLRVVAPPPPSSPVTMMSTSSPLCKVAPLVSLPSQTVVSPTRSVLPLTGSSISIPTVIRRSSPVSFRASQGNWVSN